MWGKLQAKDVQRHFNKRFINAISELLESRRLLSVAPLISEFMAQNNTSITDEDGDHSDWMEIYNPNPTSLNLNGYFLADKPSNLTHWKFPNVSLAGRGYMIVWASNKNRTDPSKPLHTNFALSKSGEYLALVEPDGKTIDQQFAPAFPPQNPDVSYGIPLTNSTLVGSADAVTYTIPQSGALGTTWTASTFDDSTWSAGANGVGFDTSGTLSSAINTNVQSSMLNKETSAYLRVSFNVADPSQLDALTLRMRYNDGFIAYLNGTQIVQKNAPSNPQWNSTASASGPDGAPAQDFDVSNFLSLIQPGQNVLAIDGMNQSKSDPDFLIQPQLIGINARTAAPTFLTPTPGAINNANAVTFVSDTKFDHDRGFYTSPFDLVISTNTPGATIRYTTDGSAPTTSGGTVYTAPIHVTTTTMVRALAYKPGMTPTDVDAQTYIFPDDVIHQPATIPGYPNPSEPINNPGTGEIDVPLDYEMDPTVVNDPAYKDAVADALESIPTLSIGVNPGDIFGANGFYDTPLNTDNVEKPISFEYIDPAHPQDNIQVNAGISGHSKQKLKRSFNIHFRKSYGVGTLDSAMLQDAPEGGDSATDQIDQLILRAGNNRSWATTFAPSKTTYTEDEFVRQSQIAMSGLGTHGTFVQLYINGIYWGLYNAVERPDAGFGAAYTGGNKDNWFAISQDGPQDGDATRWNYMINTLTSKDMSSSANYNEMKSYLDVQEYADYIINQWYSGVSDWPSNNWWAGGDTSTNMPFQFYSWDGEYMFNTLYLPTNPPASPPNGAWVNPYFQNGNTDNNGPLVKLWRALKTSPDFMTMFADRAFKALANNGALTDAAALARWDTLNNDISDGMIDESARWGDSMSSTGRLLRTRDGDWAPAVKAIRDLIPGNAQKLISAMQDAGFYPDTSPATMSQEGGLIPSGYKLGLTNPNSGGTLYYTTDGSDPRLPGGGVNSSAKTYTGTKISLNSNTQIRLRVKNGSEWSALNDATFSINTIANLRVTELMYHPKPPKDSVFQADEFEFIELKNTGNVSLNLNGVQLAGGISFTFGNVNLAAGQHILVVKDQAAFESLYGTGLNIAGEYGGKLSDSGDEVKLLAPGNVTLADFTYSDAWYPSTDGDGYSLVVVNPTDDPTGLNDPSAWQPSGAIDGTPGADESSIAPNSVVINELLSASTGTDGDEIELKNTTNQPIDISDWFLSDSSSNLKKFQIPSGTTLAAGGYIVFTEAADFGLAFAFGGSGESAYLSSADATGALTGYQASVSFGAADSNVPFARYVNSAGDAKFVAESAATFGSDNAPPIVGPIVINEIQYHPLTGGAEFLELVNTSNSTVDLTGWTFVNGITFTFASTSLDAGAMALLTDIDPATFRSTYRIPAGVPIFQFTGSLDNAGETVALAKPQAPGSANDVLVDSVSFDDASPWPTAPDGTGATLAKKTATVFGDDPIAWQASTLINGTPGRDNATLNQKPSVNAGVDQNITLPNAATLSGSTSDDDLPAGLPLTTHWSEFSGPASVVFADATKLSTTATFSVPGTYVLRLTADDGAIANTDDMSVIVTGNVSFSAKVNFQPASAPVPAGYSVDSGLAFGSRGGGLSFGWKTANTTQTRDRNSAASPDQRYDTLIQTTTGTASVWEMAVPNGSYQVHLVAGDPGYIDSIYKFNAEGVLILSGTPTSAKHWIEATATVIVADGRLTITNATGASNNKLDYIDITSVGGPTLPQVSIAATDASAAEANLDPGLFTFTRSGDTSQPLTLNFTVGGTATNGADYNSISTSVIIPAGQASTTLTITPKDDTTVESTESVTLSLSTSANYTISASGSATVNIADNDASPPPGGFSAKINFQPAGTPVPSGYLADSGLVYADRGNGLTYGWTSAVTQSRDRNAANSPDQRYDTLLQTATGSAWTWEIAVPNGTYQVHLVAGDPGYIDSVYKFNVEGALFVNGTPTSANHWVEGTGTVTVADGRLAITNATGAVNNKIDFVDIQSVGTPPTLPQVTVNATDANAAEAGRDPGVFTFARTGDTTQPLTVNFTIGGSATNGTDYDSLPTSVVIPAGQASATLNVTPIDDAVVDPNETVVVNLANSANYTVGASGNASITIADNDASPSLLNAKINFQPAGAPVPSGYLADSGLVYADRGNGLTYGWTSAVTQSRDRNAANSPDQRYDTLLQTATGSAWTWEIAVPNGTYQVHLVAGDPGYIDSVYKFNVEGALLVNGTPTSANHWVEGTGSVTVTDGRLTITNATGAVNNKIDFIDVQRLS